MRAEEYFLGSSDFYLRRNLPRDLISGQIVEPQYFTQTLNGASRSLIEFTPAALTPLITSRIADLCAAGPS
jgi:hypothetical protein